MESRAIAGSGIQGERRQLRSRANTSNSNEKTDNFGGIAFRIPIELAYIVQDGRSAGIRAWIWAKTSLGDPGTSILVTAMESRVIIGSEIQGDHRQWRSSQVDVQGLRAELHVQGIRAELNVERSSQADVRTPSRAARGAIEPGGRSDSELS